MMKKSIFAAMAAAVVFSAARAFAGTDSLSVVVQNAQGQGIASAAVIAIYFSTNGPDSSATQIAFTNSAGTATFSPGTGNGLTDTDSYQIVVSSQGFFPSIAQQLNNGAQGYVAAAGSPTSINSVPLSSVGVSSVGVIFANVTNASAALIFGQLQLQGGGGTPVAYGLATISAGNGTLAFSNVPYAAANSYVISAFDPQKNIAANTPVNNALNAGTSPLNGGTLNFNGGIPPSTNLSQQAAGQVSVVGVVTDTTSAHNPIPNVWINFNGVYSNQYGGSQNDNRGTNTDRNGTFQLYGLNPGTTYYTNVGGACNNGTCYVGINDCPPNPQGFSGCTPGPNDIVYPSTGGVQNLNVQLQAVSGGSGSMGVQLMLRTPNGLLPLMQSGISVYGDYKNWDSSNTVDNACSNSVNSYISNSGLAQYNVQTSTGYYYFTNLPSGNYQINANTSFGGYTVNDGPDGSFNSGGSNSSFTVCGSDDFRVTIDTTQAASADVKIFNSSGALIAQGSSVTAIVPLPTGGNLAGLVEGTISLPGVENLSQDPITISLNPNCSGQCSGADGGFLVLNTSTGPTIGYSIPVSTGSAYWVDVNSSYWGPVYAGGNQPQPNLISTNTFAMNLSFAPAGRILGYLIKPDGSVYLPPPSQGGGGANLGINAEGQNAWAQGQLNNDGSFVIGGALPGVYTLAVQAFGSGFPYITKSPAPTVTVIANQDVTQNVPLDYGVPVLPVVSTASLPALPGADFACLQRSNSNNGACPPENYAVFALPHGKAWTTALFNGFLNFSNNVPGEYNFSPSSGNNNVCNGTFLSQAGFCYGSIAAAPAVGNSVAGTDYDFYVARKAGFDSQGNENPPARPFITFYASTQSVVSQAAANVPIEQCIGSACDLAAVVDSVTIGVPNLSGVGQAVLVGTVTISAGNVLTQQQFQALGGDFKNFLNYIPLAWLYDSSGTLKAMGMVTPLPTGEEGVNDRLQNDVSAGNYNDFVALMSTSTGWGPVGFDIRGLIPNTTYQMVITSPNYPSFKEQVYTGASGSTTPWNVNLTSNPGESISGVVEDTTTAHNPIGSADVSIQAPGIPATNVVTSTATGGYSALGLAAGTYNVTVEAPGYAYATQSISLTGSGNYSVPTFYLNAGNASISGQVQSAPGSTICPPNSTNCVSWKPAALSGAEIVAYDDTVNLASPTAVVPLITVTSAPTGSYMLNNLVAGDIYKVFADAHASDGRGYYVVSETFTATAGGTTGANFSLAKKPLAISLNGYINGNNYEFIITGLAEFNLNSGKSDAWIGTAPFSKSNSTDVAQTGFCSFNSNGPNNTAVMDCPLTGFTAGTTYILHFEGVPLNTATDGSLVIQEFNFGINLPASSCQNIDETLLGDNQDANSLVQSLLANEAGVDASGQDSSGVSFPIGAVIPSVSTGAVPSLCMTGISTSSSTTTSGIRGPRSSTVYQTSLGAVTVPNAAAAGNIYTVNLSSVNFTGNGSGAGVNLSLSYNQSGTDLTNLAVYSYSTNTATWSQITTGQQTIDPVHHTITINGIQSLTGTLSVSKARANGLYALADRGFFRPTGTSTSDSGIFAVMKPSGFASSATFTTSSVNIYNFPNPFNLNFKTETLNTSTCNGGLSSISTPGTVIKYELPPSVTGGHSVLRIYTISGRLVKEIDQGNVSGGSGGACYYTSWDGTNRQGTNVADGIYYGILSVPGMSWHDGTFKMAVKK